MSSVVIAGDTSGTVTLDAPAVAGTTVLTLPATSGAFAIQNSSNNFLMNSGYGSDAAAYGCRAWVNFNGSGTVAIRGSGNVSSITDNGVGIYTVNFTTAMPDANYSVCGTSGASTGNAAISLFESISVGKTTSLVQVVAATTSSPFDSTTVSVAIFR